MSLLDKIKKLSSNSVSVQRRTADIFPPLDTDHVIRSTRLFEKAKENGSSNIPTQSATTRDSVELDIKRHVTELSDIYERDYSRELEVYKSRVSRYINIQDMSGIRTEYDAKLSNIKTDLVNKKNQVLNEARQLRERGNEIRLFRQVNNLTHRLPDYPKDMAKAWMIISFLALIELALHFLLLKESSDVMTVMVQSLIYGLLNVIVPFALFSRLVRYINHVNPIYKSLGFITIILYLIYTLVINLLIAHFRSEALSNVIEIGQNNVINQELIERYLQTALTALSNFQSNWFGLKDIWSWMIFALGCVLSFGAIMEGYVSDDKYPGYGNVHRNYKSDYDDFTEALEELTESQTRERDQAMTELKNNIRSLTDNFNTIPDIIQSAATLRERHYKALESLDTAYNMLLKEYRQKNSEYRTEPAPKYFDQECKLEKPDLMKFEVPQPKYPSVLIEELRECSDELHTLYQENIDNLPKTEDLLLQDPFKVELN